MRSSEFTSINSLYNTNESHVKELAEFKKKLSKINTQKVAITEKQRETLDNIYQNTMNPLIVKYGIDNKELSAIKNSRMLNFINKEDIVNLLKSIDLENISQIDQLEEIASLFANHASASDTVEFLSEIYEKSNDKTFKHHKMFKDSYDEISSYIEFHVSMKFSTNEKWVFTSDIKLLEERKEIECRYFLDLMNHPNADIIVKSFSDATLENIIKFSDMNAVYMDSLDSGYDVPINVVVAMLGI